MVKIQSVDELKRIKQTLFGFVIVIDTQDKATMHKSNCKFIKEDNFLESKKLDSATKFHWFSTYRLAEKEFKNISSCKNCNP